MIDCVAVTKVHGVNIQDARRDRLGKWVTAHGGHAEVVVKYGLTPSDASYLSQLVNGYSFGERSARNWEARLKLPDGFLDQETRAEQPPGAYSQAHPMSLTEIQAPLSITWESVLKPTKLPAQFVCAVPDDALGQDTPKGTRYIFAAGAAPSPGVAIIVEDRAGYRYLRRYVQGAGDQWFAAARNDDYATLRSDTDGLTILAVAQWRGDGSA